LLTDGAFHQMDNLGSELVREIVVDEEVRRVQTWFFNSATGIHAHCMDGGSATANVHTVLDGRADSTSRRAANNWQDGGLERPRSNHRWTNDGFSLPLRTSSWMDGGGP
jgi:hypothetical protein